MNPLTKGDYLEMEKIFLKSLSPTKKRTLRKLNPYRKERNLLIRKLAGRGVPTSLLAKVSGISPIQIYRILIQDFR
jgi:hypothetical protein